MDTASFLPHLKTRNSYDGQIVHVEHIPSRQATYAELEEPLSPVLQNCLCKQGVSSFYSHQAEAVNKARLGKNVMVATFSASGKTLCYNIAVLEELLAEAIHFTGLRAFKPLVKVNCSALVENLLESELFGHVKGAFTGALKDKIGRFQKADGGTIFLDEIGDIPPRLQLKLLRVLQEKEFERVGDSTPIKVDIRVIASTNSNLKEKVRKGEFREDLYYRLKVVEVNLPPLRKRREDIPLLMEHFGNLFNQRFSKNIQRLANEVQKVFMNYSWPGNIRELEHALEHAYLLCRDDTITLEDLPEELKDYSKRSSFSITEENNSESSEIILQALKKTDWNKAKAARLLRISRQTLYRKIQEFKLENPEH